MLAARDIDQLVLLRGDGDGFRPSAERVDLPGGVSALAAGDVNRRDGLEDLVVAVHGGRTATLLVFESPVGALRGEPEAVALTAPANGVDVGKLVSGSFVDIVVATPGEVMVVEGRDEVDVFFTDRGTTFTVNTTDDLDDEYCTALHCSLRETIDAADALAGTDTIEFAIGFNPILLTESLPNIHYPVVIDGLQGTCPMSCFPTQIDGSGAGVNAIAFDVNGGGVTLSHLIVHDLNGIAIDLAGDGNVVENCQIGVDRAGNAAANGVGLVLQGSSGNTIGGTTADLGNVISGNLGHGVEVRANADRMQIQGNIIGLAIDGHTSRPNLGAGVVLDSADSSLVGGIVAAAGNFISRNTGWGMVITGSGVGERRFTGR